MSILNPTVGTRTSLTVSGLGTLANVTYAVSNTYTANTNKPVDVVVEVEAATTNTPSGNKELLVFLKESLDGTNFRTGPETGTTATDEPDLLPLGSVKLNTASTTHRATFSVAQTLGYVPHSFKVVFKANLGVALTSAACYTAEISGVIT